MSVSVSINPPVQRVLMLGASGLVGRMLRAVWDAMPPQNIEIAPVFNTIAGEGPGLAWTPGDDLANLPRCDVILALWGVKAGPDAPLAENSRLARIAMTLGRDLGARRVLHASSAAVYRPGPEPLREDSDGTPPTAYGAAKRDMERAVAAWQADNPGGPEAVHMRIGNVAGADSLFINMARGNRIRLDRFPDGTSPRRSYVAPHDLARAVEALCLSGMTGPVNVGAPEPTGMDEIAKAAGAEVDYVAAPDSALPVVSLDVSRLMRICPFPPDAAEASHLVDSARATGVWP